MSYENGRVNFEGVKSFLDKASIGVVDSTVQPLIEQYMSDNRLGGRV